MHISIYAFIYINIQSYNIIYGVYIYFWNFMQKKTFSHLQFGVQLMIAPKLFNMNTLVSWNFIQTKWLPNLRFSTAMVAKSSFLDGVAHVPPTLRIFYLWNFACVHKKNFEEKTCSAFLRHQNDSPCFVGVQDAYIICTHHHLPHLPPQDWESRTYHSPMNLQVWKKNRKWSKCNVPEFWEMLIPWLFKSQ